MQKENATYRYVLGIAMVTSIIFLGVNSAIPAADAAIVPTVMKSGYGLGARFSYSPADDSAGMEVRFLYEGSTADLGGFRLYEAKPGSASFTRVADFADLSDVGGATYRIISGWKLGRVAGTTSWLITRVLLDNPAGVPYYAPMLAWSVGDYRYYLTAYDRQGNEGAASQTTTAHMVEPLTLTAPAAGQPAPLKPTFRWTLPVGMPTGQNRHGFQIRLYEGGKEIWVGINPEADDTKTYDGPGLQEGKTYTAHIHLDLASATQYPLESYFALPRAATAFTVSAMASSPIAVPPAALPPPSAVMPLPVILPVVKPPAPALSAPARSAPHERVMGKKQDKKLVETALPAEEEKPKEQDKKTVIAALRGLILALSELLASLLK